MVDEPDPQQLWQMLQAYQARLITSVGYRIRKFAGRHRGGLFAAMLILGSLVAGLIGVGWFWAEARRAQTERAIATNNLGVSEQKRGELAAALQAAEEQRSMAERARKAEEIAKMEAIAAEAERSKMAMQARTASDEAKHQQQKLTEEYQALLFSALAEPMSGANPSDADSLVKNSARRLYSAAKRYLDRADSSTGAVEATLACGIINLGFPQQAKKLLEDGTAARRQLDSKISWRLSIWCNDAADVLQRAGHYALAEPLLLESFETQRKNSKGTLADARAMEATQDKLIELYGKMNRPEDQAKWRNLKQSRSGSK